MPGACIDALPSHASSLPLAYCCLNTHPPTPHSNPAAAASLLGLSHLPLHPQDIQRDLKSAQQQRELTEVEAAQLAAINQRLSAENASLAATADSLKVWGGAGQCGKAGIAFALSYLHAAIGVLCQLGSFLSLPSQLASFPSHSGLLGCCLPLQAENQDLAARSASLLERQVGSCGLQLTIASASGVCKRGMPALEPRHDDGMIRPACTRAACHPGCQLPISLHTATPIHHDPRAGSPAAPTAQAALEAAAEGLKLENSALIQQFDRLKLRFEAESAAFQEQVGGRVGLGGSTRIGGLLDGGAWVQTMHCQCCGPASRGAKRAIKVQPLPAGLAWLNLLPQPFHPCTAV